MTEEGRWAVAQQGRYRCGAGQTWAAAHVLCGIPSANITAMYNLLYSGQMLSHSTASACGAKVLFLLRVLPMPTLAGHQRHHGASGALAAVACRAPLPTVAHCTAWA